jgi:histidinol-phosphate aminotransferase
MFERDGLGVIDPAETGGSARGGAAPTDLAHNESPWGPAPAVVEAATCLVPDANRYPEPYGRSLTEAIAAHHGVRPSNVVVGSGGTQILTAAWTAFADAGQCYAYSWPGFALYPMAEAWLGLKPVALPLTPSRGEDLSAFARAIDQDDVGMVMLCNPHNPTGTYLPDHEVRAFLEAIPDEVLVVLDEAYAEYATAKDFPDLADEAVARPNLVLMRSFSKIYGLASLRVGYGLAAEPVVERLRSALPPYAVGTPALEAARVAIADQEEIRWRAERTAAAADTWTRALRARGMAVVPTQSNFLLASPPVERDWAGDLQAQGVLVRAIGPDIRITIGTEPQLHHLCTALDAILDGRPVSEL